MTDVGRAPGPLDGPVPVALFSLRGGLTLTAVSGGSTRWNTIGAGDTVSSITVGGTEILGSTITYATSVAATCKTAVKTINAYSSPYWATFDGTDKILIWPRLASAQDTGAVVTTDTGFTATDVNMNTEQAFVAAVRWPNVNLGDDAIGGTSMYRVGFDFSNMYSGQNGADGSDILTKLKGVEMVLQTEDATLDVYIGPEGKIQLSATPADNDIEERTFSVLGCAMGLMDMFIQSGGAQNPVFHLRCW